MKLRHLGVLFLISCLASFIGLGLSYPSLITPKGATSLKVDGLHPDGWVEDGTTIALPRLVSYGNSLIFGLQSWRPNGLPPAIVHFFVCGKLAGEIAVDHDGAYTIPVRGECDPKIVEIKVLNPFTPGKSDGRPLGVKLSSAQLTSRLFLPLLHPLWILLVGGMIFLPTLLFLSAARNANGIVRSLAYATPLALFLLLSISTTPSNEQNALTLWTLFTALAAGVCFASHHPYQAEGRGDGEKKAGKGRWALYVFVASIVLAGGLIRFYGLSFGLPLPFHPDETPKVNAITRMIMYQDLNPRYFLHPSLLLYLSFFGAKLYQATHLLPAMGLPEDIPTLIRLAGRTVSAFAGTLSILLTYCIGRSLYSPFVGLIGSMLLAFSPLHVTSSRYMKEDALMTLWILFVVYFVVRAVVTRRTLYLVGAAISVGLACGTKYSGALSWVILASSPFLVGRLSRDSEAIVPGSSWKLQKSFFWMVCFVSLLIPFVFFFTTPYSILDSQGFLKGLNSEHNHMLNGHTVAIDAWSQYWMYHLSRSVFPGMTFFPALISLVGIGVLLWRRKREDLFLVALILLFYLPAEWVKAKPAPQPERYIFPCLPFLALAVGEFLRVFANSKFRVAVPLLVVATLSFPIVKSIQYASEVPVDTRVKMTNWMNDHLPHGGKVVVDYSPYGPGFVDNSFSLDMMHLADILVLFNRNKLQESGYDYMILSSLTYDRFFSQPNDNGLRRQLVRQMFQTIPILKVETSKQGTYGFHNPMLTLFSLKKGDSEEKRNRGLSYEDTDSPAFDPWNLLPKNEVR